MFDFKKIKRNNSEVIYATEKFISISKSDILNLIEQAKLTNRKRVRLCSHLSSNDTVHEMFIVHPKDAYVRPHKHLNRVESMLVLSGEVDYITFNKEGDISDYIQMGDFSSNKDFYISIKDEQYHSLLIKSEWLVLLEITKGPFNKKDTIFANWSPKDDDKDGIEQFIKKLKGYSNI